MKFSIMQTFFGFRDFFPLSLPKMEDNILQRHVYNFCSRLNERTKNRKADFNKIQHNRSTPRDN